MLQILSFHDRNADCHGLLILPEHEALDARLADNWDFARRVITVLSHDAPPNQRMAFSPSVVYELSKHYTSTGQSEATEA